jgi:Arc/MetJ-type ribon-helix-helix transcriptional regulator
MSVVKTSKRAGGSKRGREEDYEEYMAGIPSAAPAIAGSVLEREHHTTSRSTTSPVIAASSDSVAVSHESLSVESSPIEVTVEASEMPNPAAVNVSTEAVVTTDVTVATDELAIADSSSVLRPRRSKTLAELKLPKYTAGGRPPAPDLAGVAPIRQSITLTPQQVKRLQREVQRRKRAGQSADLSSVCRELIEGLQRDGFEGTLSRGVTGVRLVQQTVYLTPQQIEWMVGEVVRRRAKGEHADKSSLLRAAIDRLSE